MRRLLPLLILASLVAATPAAAVDPVPPTSAGPVTTLAAIRARGFVRCGAPQRPGLAKEDGTGDWHGLEVEVCRAVAVAVFGKGGRFVFHNYDSDKAFAEVRAGQDDLSFVSFAEMGEHGLDGALLPGEPVFVEGLDLMVAVSSPVQAPADLAGQSVCFHTGDPANAQLDAFFVSRKLPLIRFAMSEYGEMYDAFHVQRCKAVVDEATSLAAERADGAGDHLRFRILPRHLGTMPIVAATPSSEDARWASIVGWTIRTLVAADRPETRYDPGGLRATHVDGAALGLPPDWQKTVVAAVGSYSQMFSRTLGAGSPLKLDQRSYAPVEQGGVLAVPATD